MSFKSLLNFLSQYTDPSDFYIKIQSIVREEKNFFNSLPKSDKTGNIYEHRIAELEALNNMLLKVRDDATFQIRSALNIDLPPMKSDDDHTESSFSESYSDGSYPCEYIFINPSPRPQKYYPDDTNLYILCANIVNKTETPFWHYFTGKNNLIAKIANVIKEVENQKITILHHQNYMLKLANLLILDLKKPIQKSDETAEGKKPVNLNRIPRNTVSQADIEDLVAHSMIKPPNIKLSPKPQIKKKENPDSNINPLSPVQHFLNGCL